MLKTIKRGIAGHIDITFKSLDSVIKDVSQQLANIDYEADSSYIAVYVSPIGKTDWGHIHYNTIYALLKELCLKHRIVLQGITQEHINASNYNFELFFTNIYAAILAKLGGIPWAISPVNSDDMIIGVGAFYSQKKGKRYIGSAFCFDGSYLMKEYDCIHVNDREDFVSKIYQAIDRFARNKDGVIPNYAALGPLCVEKIGPEMQRLGYKCPAPGYCFTIEHNKEYRPTDIDIEYCEQVEEMDTDNTIIQFKHLDAVPKALCMKHVGPYERFHESFTEAFAYMEEQGYKMAGALRTSYIDGAWNQEDPEQWLSVIQIPIE